MNYNDLLQHYTKTMTNTTCDSLHKRGDKKQLIDLNHSRPWNIYVIFCFFRPSSGIRKRLGTFAIGSYCHRTIVISDYLSYTTVLLLITLITPFWFLSISLLGGRGRS